MKCAVAFLLPLLLISAATTAAQNAPPAASGAAPVVTFEVFWDQATPQAYTITVQSTGETRYVSRNPTKPPDENGVRDEDFEMQFAMSTANRDRVFSLAEQSNYFNGEFDYKKHSIANTGKKTLTYTDSARHFAASYNWSENSAVDQLTNLFQGISNVIEHGRKLQFLRRFDKLGLENELKAMEEQAEHHYLYELQVVAPILESIAGDPAILNIARQRAKRLLARIAQEEAHN